MFEDFETLPWNGDPGSPAIARMLDRLNTRVLEPLDQRVANLEELARAQMEDIKRLQAVVWLQTQMLAGHTGMDATELEVRVQRAIDEVMGVPAPEEHRPKPSPYR